MLQDADGYLWLSNFVNKYEIIEMGAITSYHMEEGLARSVPYFIDQLPYFSAGIIDHQGHLWMTRVALYINMTVLICRSIK